MPADRAHHALRFPVDINVDVCIDLREYYVVHEYRNIVHDTRWYTWPCVSDHAVHDANALVEF